MVTCPDQHCNLICWNSLLPVLQNLVNDEGGFTLLAPELFHLWYLIPWFGGEQTLLITERVIAYNFIGEIQQLLVAPVILFDFDDFTGWVDLWET